MRNLVTGGAGFLGSNLCEKLVGLGQDVICLDDFSTGRTSNVANLLESPSFVLMEWDLREPFQVDVDRIYNLACPASPPAYQADAIGTTLTSVLGVLNVLRVATSSGARVLQASTSEVYGDPHIHPQSEDYWGHVNPIGLRSCYDEGKRVAESLFFDYWRTHGTDIRVVRIFNTYGPKMRPDDGRVISNFIVQALRGEALTIYGKGEQTRSFCYVDDLVDGLLAAMDAPAGTTGPINLGNSQEFTVLGLAELLGSIFPHDLELNFAALPSDDPRQRCPDTRLAREILGWEPRTALYDGLVHTIAYFRTQIGAR